MRTKAFHFLLSPQAMARVDQAAASSGMDSYGLMQRAGEAVAAAALKRFPGALRYAVLCGPGNNGGDGYVAAAALHRAGAITNVFHLGEPERLKGDAARARLAWNGDSEPLSAYQPMEGDVVIDALFGAGLARAVDAAVARAVEAVEQAGCPVLAVDLPSGVDGLTGAVLGAAFQASHTVTFMAKKPGHLLLPGRTLCGTLEVFDIGIPMRLVAGEAGTLAENHPDLWRASLPRLSGASHKFRRGHLTVFSGPASATGAARLSAMAGLKAGAGLVTLAASGSALLVNANHTTAIMVKRLEGREDLDAYLADPRMAAFVLGPGFGVGDKARDFALALKERALVLDADGLTSFKEDPAALFGAFAGGQTRLVLTPHEGEFSRLFPDLAADESLGKVEKALTAAARAHAVLVCKGADSVIASPDGRAVINTNAPSSLATAGSGDVLAGIIGGLLAQGMPAFEAASAGVWLHGDAAARARTALTAEDLALNVQTQLSDKSSGSLDQSRLP
ncbi:NAD(P)H-hydrate dehydratase [Rhizobium paknamense]|uniref:Bifunctional NAD(P)H-hydrate repair enzyme n=1 Tax=Rhizobium paknamense TaxID=1206817 RepID=A0ABU0I6C0_9HYPH|nr:NAD(P)H-hydrate dehydratase [Rhizobium paknamense]MDQ0453766.1 NAD(P)H-hydrate epimerase [Rhizobium paknamense]